MRYEVEIRVERARVETMTLEQIAEQFVRYREEIERLEIAVEQLTSGEIEMP